MNWPPPKGSVTILECGPKPPDDLSKRLRELADAVDRNEVTELVAAYVQDGCYEFLYGAGLNDSLVMSTMLQHSCLMRMKR